MNPRPLLLLTTQINLIFAPLKNAQLITRSLSIRMVHPPHRGGERLRVGEFRSGMGWGGALILNIMNNYDRGYDTLQYRGGTYQLAETALMKNVYIWMSGALALTGLAAYYVGSSFDMLNLIFSNSIVFYGLIIAEIGLVMGLSAAINRISATTATLMFILYSIINGVTLSSIFVVYTMSSIATTFFVTAGTFGAMALYGATTKADLSKMGNILLMALIGLIIAGVVNIFVKSTMLETIVSGIGVLIFTGLTAYDAQKIKAMLRGADDDEMGQKIAVLGALSLYLDFINLFLYLIRFMGSRRD